MDLEKFLKDQHAPHTKTHHPTVYMAQQLAAGEHVSGYNVINPSMVNADDRMVMCAIQAPRCVDLGFVKEILGAKDVRLATEEEMATRLPDVEVGAEAPIGRLFDIERLADKGMEEDGFVVFQAGNHRDAIRMSLVDFLRVSEPRMAELGSGS